MKTKARKSQELAKLKEKLPKSKITVFTSFAREGEKGLSVAQMTQLKRLLRSIKSEYFVTKKTLIDLATGKDDKLGVYGIKGSVGLVLGYEDPYGLAKKIYEFSRKNQALQFSGAMMDGEYLDAARFMEIAKMPSKEVLLGRLVGMLTYPMRGLAVSLSEIAKQKTS
jgi:large subunit ribosomal protein L10